MTEEYLELAGRGLLEGRGMRAQQAPPPLAEEAGSGHPAAFTSAGGVTLRCNSANRSGRRARRVSVGPSEDALATDSGESEELTYMKELPSVVSEPVQVHLGVLYDSTSQSLLLHLLQLKNLSKASVRDGHKVYVKVHLVPVEPSRACCAFYCCKALEPQALVTFNEGFRIPVATAALATTALQLSLCSLGPQAHEELLGTAQLGLADCEGGLEMVFHWLRVQMAESVDSGCSSSTQYPGPCQEGLCYPVAPGDCRAPVAKVEKATMTEGLYPEQVRVRGGRFGHASPFIRSSTIVRSQTFSPGARSHYVCRLYRSDSDSSTLPKKSPFVRNTLERRTLRYKQACRTRQRQLGEELSALRELKANQSQQEQRQEEAAERMLRKASKEVLQMRGQGQKEPLPVHTFREKMAFFTRPRFHVPSLPADDV
ncbi:hypothetical protein CRUP_015608 [Coryphaenoides rupestris]|nr:hypothetical protein CRUP_015608 [Coryphaenoides rupestris]